MTDDELRALILASAETCPKCGSIDVDEPPALQAPPLIRVLVCLDCGARSDGMPPASER